VETDGKVLGKVGLLAGGRELGGGCSTPLKHSNAMDTKTTISTAATIQLPLDIFLGEILTIESPRELFQVLCGIIWLIIP